MLGHTRDQAKFISISTICAYVCAYVCAYMCVYVYVCVHKCVCMCVLCIVIHILTHIQTETHTHTHTHSHTIFENEKDSELMSVNWSMQPVYQGFSCTNYNSVACAEAEVPGFQ